MLAVLREPREAGTLLILAHQPGIGVLARRLLAGAPEGDADFDKFPTGATAVIDFDVADWPDVGWQAGRLVDFVVPRALES